MKVVAILVLVAAVATAQQFGFSNNNNFYNSFDNRYQGNFPQQFDNNQYQSQYQDDFYRQRENRFQQGYQSGTSQQYDNEEYGVFEPLNLPSGASYMYGDISSSFSCADRPYGYYADVDNYCQFFHICNPTRFEDGTVQTYQYSMMCGEGTQFDQRTLTCVERSAASPCQDAPSFYWINESFGLPHEKY